ncbi:hypothetical protein Tco_0890906 [Tanacetum coccineum]|uniref:Uncharacterized protein n=1 Tax=Tanacetum coccineum TaxID=301880 RepID=A0ABQ5C6X2_9ASTR
MNGNLAVSLMQNLAMTLCVWMPILDSVCIRWIIDLMIFVYLVTDVWVQSNVLSQFGAHDLHRLHICEELADTWVWVSSDIKRQQVAAAATQEAAEGAPDDDEGVQADPAPIQAPQPPLAAAWSMPQRIIWLDEKLNMDARVPDLQAFDETIVGTSDAA